MTIVVPRLDREVGRRLLAAHLGSDATAIGSAMPLLSEVVTYPPVGGSRIEREELFALRGDLLGIAREHGMPGSPQRLPEFEARCARRLHEKLGMSPHEASHDEVWTYLTCCWLLDVAVWRFGTDADERRFLGNVNRNTFRRMWWRAEVLGPGIDLSRLGEDELVNIMERPTIAADRRLARGIAGEFLRRVERGEGRERMQLMRDAMKRLLRLSPFVSFAALADDALHELVSDTFDAAVAGLGGMRFIPPVRPTRPPETPSPEVTPVPTVVLPAAAAMGDDTNGGGAARDLDTICDAALGIARRTGRVTNMTLRETAPISSDQAREVFSLLIRRGALVRRGVKRGTYYVIPDESGTASAPTPPHGSEPPPSLAPPSRPPPPRPRSPSPPPARMRPAEAALRKLLKRGR